MCMAKADHPESETNEFILILLLLKIVISKTFNKYQHIINLFIPAGPNELINC